MLLQTALVHVSDYEMKDICYKKLRPKKEKATVNSSLNQKRKLGDFKACYFGRFGRLRQTPTTNIRPYNAYDRLRPQAGCLRQPPPAF